MNDKEIRWKQRFSNFQRALRQLEEAFNNLDRLSVLEKEGLIQRFEYTFELAWKTVKDFLEAEGVMAVFPREVIKNGFHYEIIANGEAWMDMLEKRNLLAHTYDEKNFLTAINKIKNEYYKEILQVYKYLECKL